MIVSQITQTGVAATVEPTPTATPTPTEPTSTPSTTTLTPSETVCGSVDVGESCTYLEPNTLDFFGVTLVLIVLLLAGILAAQLRRP